MISLAVARAPTLYMRWGCQHRQGALALVGFITAFPGILQTPSCPWRSDNGCFFPVAMRASGESHGNVTRAIKGTLGWKWLLRKSCTLAPLPAGTAASRELLPHSQLCVAEPAKAENPLPLLLPSVGGRALWTQTLVPNSTHDY